MNIHRGIIEAGDDYVETETIDDVLYTISAEGSEITVTAAGAAAALEVSWPNQCDVVLRLVPFDEEGNEEHALEITLNEKLLQDCLSVAWGRK